MNKTHIGAFFLFFILMSVPVYSSVSIGTRYGTIVLEDVSPGRVYNLTEMRDMPYLVINRGSRKGNVKISVIPPQNPRDGYEPIPDPGWLNVRPSEFELDAGERMPASLILSVPDDEKYAGRHYHALLRVENVGSGFFGAAVVNNFYFSVGTPGPETVKEAKAKEVLSDLNYDVNPESLYLDIPSGERVDILKELDKSLQIINRGRQDVKLAVESVENEPGFPSREGYSFTPSIDYLWAEPDTVDIPSYQIRDINLYAEIPDEYKGQKMMFIIAVYPEEMEFARLYSRVYVNVE